VRTVRAQVASDDTFTLAEGPVWDPTRDRVLWVDIEGGLVLEGRLDDSRVACTDRHAVDGTVGAVVTSEDGRLLVAGSRTLTALAADGRHEDSLVVIPADQRSRLNDGACDPMGRFLVGSMAMDGRKGSDRLYRVEDDLTVGVIDDDLTLSNGLAWSPDSTSFYSVDSIPGIVWVRSYRNADGLVGERRELLRIRDGIPDGLCVDVNGNLWIAIWGVGQVRCYSSQGEHLVTVEVPAPHTSSCAFVGPQRDLLLITTARADLTNQQLAEFPHSGQLFTVDVGVAGISTTPWNGQWPSMDPAQNGDQPCD
jgi:sugar lactone lactonase YvrE